MKFAHFFIDRPIFAGVISILITLIGGIALWTLPIAQYPDIAPPTIQVTASYPGANAQTVADTVARPIEQQVNGVENMLYMSSQSTSDGNLMINITFRLGTNLDTAQVQVQNRVAIAVPTLPSDVQRIGVTTKKQSPDITMVVHLLSPDGSLDSLFTSNYALLQVRDELARLDGVGDINVFGAREYSMRIWLDPNKVAARGLTAQDVVQSIQEQNVQVAAGIVGAQPAPAGATAFQYTVNTQGRLADEKEFGAIVIKTGADGKVTRVRDVARVELAARDYTANSQLGGKPATAIGIFQRPGSNALATSDAVRAKMEELKTRFPTGLDYRIQYDPTISVRESIHEVQKTLFEAIGLVVIVVLVFLQTWRASIIPLLAVPVSLIGTFAAMAAFGFSLNNLSLFGLVLAIGIVVDDAIVVVENIEHHIANGLGPRDAARKAMDEVSGAVVAVALVLGAVFVPTAFMTGITGQFFRQFALTIAVSTLISALNSLTLSPALGAILLKPHGAEKDWFQKLLDGVLGWFFRGFNPRIPLVLQCLWRHRRPDHPARGHRSPRLRRPARTHCARVQGSARRFPSHTGPRLRHRLLPASRCCVARPHAGGHRQDGENCARNSRRAEHDGNRRIQSLWRQSAEYRRRLRSFQGIQRAQEQGGKYGNHPCDAEPPLPR
jgi:multidrug efflux pump